MNDCALFHPPEIDGTKMKLSKAVILLFLALIFKVALAEITVNYTKVYLVELEFEKSVYLDITDLLRNQTEIKVNVSTVTEINTTTDCTFNETQKNCSCRSGYTWSEDICKNHACCKDRPCSLKPEETAVCLSDKRVSINGSTKFTNDSYNILYEEKNKDTEEYKTKSQEITTLLVKEFSQLKYFDSLIINSYSIGSVIVNYTVQLLGTVTSEELEKVIKTLTDSELITTGIINITVPDNQPIDIGLTATISCRPTEPLGKVKWLLTDQDNKTTPITTGIEANLTQDNLTDIVTLSNISGSWKGMFLHI
ncbi:adhesion G protein-coupled receptor F5-like [Ctenopharyngodon idella]|uniref:adhesion G protein-coupled receptor F5-like n=1 Tax=Ctenopharyngodon idella TaxID=7959 RepID=UPI0022323F9B|nr:adhesion G protein-coupled receptor F5-like [Ctenopharyngodon idella]